MDFTTAEPASTRRSLIGAAGAAGLVGAAAAILAGSSASATATPNTPTDADLAGLDTALRLELAARDLYRAAAAQLDGADAELASVIAENHEAYAQAIAGATGTSANEADRDLVDSKRSLFATSDPNGFANAARDLEQTAMETHTGLLPTYESIDAVELTAAIIAVEARHATVLTSLAGFASNLDELLGGAA